MTSAGTSYWAEQFGQISRISSPKSSSSLACLFFILLFTILWSGCGKKSYLTALQQPLSKTDLSHKAIEADLSFLHRSVEAIVPFPYLYSDSTQVARAYAAKKNKESQSLMDFYGNVIELLGTYNWKKWTLQRSV